MTRHPLQLSYDAKHGLILDVRIAYNRTANQTLDAEWRAADWLTAGIRQAWSKLYPVTDSLASSLDQFLRQAGNFSLSPWHRYQIPFQVVIHEDPDSRKGNLFLLVVKRALQVKRRPIRIYYKRSRILPAHVASVFWRRVWGILRTGQIESIGYNWSVRFPGYAVIPTGLSLERTAKLAAHEAGHLFGLGDAYAAWYRLYHEAPGTENFMMNSNRTVHSEELAMLIRAYLQNRAQFFPREWDKTVFKREFAAEMDYYSKKIRCLRDQAKAARRRSKSDQNPGAD